MIIIKEGRVENHYFICKRCGCEFEAETGEFSYGAVFGDSMSLFTDCPCCNSICTTTIQINDEEGDSE